MPGSALSGVWSSGFDRFKLLPLDASGAGEFGWGHASRFASLADRAAERTQQLSVILGQRPPAHRSEHLLKQRVLLRGYRGSRFAHVARNKSVEEKPSNAAI
jgi:hypothetical protein